MERLTHERVSGIKSGYWSPARKDELIQRLGEYEDTGLAPAEINIQITPRPHGLLTTWETPISCPNCWAHLAVDWSFCPECGRSITEDEREAADVR